METIQVIPTYMLDAEKKKDDFVPQPEVVTFGSLYSKDLEDAYFFPERPSTFHEKAKYRNDERYVLHDYPANFSLESIEYFRPIHHCLVVGSELPILVRYQPKECMKKHWRKWCPFMPEADIRDLPTENTGDSKFITLFPMQSFPKKKHAVDPDVHHKLLDKNTIPELGARCPPHMSRHDYTVPCMVKVSHGMAGRGTYLAKTRQDAERLINHIQDDMMCNEPAISGVVEGITGNYCVQFYLFKTGKIHWLGCSSQVVTEEFRWRGGYVNWDEQEQLKEKLYKTIVPVKEYLHKHGYFGVVGIDVLTNKEGNFVVDLNARINGSTSLLLLAPHMAAQGFPSSAMLRIKHVNGNEEEVMARLDKINNLGEGVIIDLVHSELPDGKSCEIHICLFAKDEEGIKNLHEMFTGCE